MRQVLFYGACVAPRLRMVMEYWSARAAAAAAAAAAALTVGGDSAGGSLDTLLCDDATRIEWDLNFKLVPFFRRRRRRRRRCNSFGR